MVTSIRIGNSTGIIGTVIGSVRQPSLDKVNHQHHYSPSSDNRLGHYLSPITATVFSNIVASGIESSSFAIHHAPSYLLHSMDWNIPPVVTSMRPNNTQDEDGLRSKKWSEVQ